MIVSALGFQTSSVRSGAGRAAFFSGWSSGALGDREAERRPDRAHGGARRRQSGDEESGLGEGVHRCAAAQDAGEREIRRGRGGMVQVAEPQLPGAHNAVLRRYMGTHRAVGKLSWNVCQTGSGAVRVIHLRTIDEEIEVTLGSSRSFRSVKSDNSSISRTTASRT